MLRKHNITFRIYGLEQHKKAVDAEVFARKIAAFVRGLSKADKTSHNGKRCLNYLVTDLGIGSAKAVITERQANLKFPPTASGIESFHAALVAVYGGHAQRLNGSHVLLPPMKSLCGGASKTFSHIDVLVDDDPGSAVRVDSFFVKQLEAAVEYVAAAKGEVRKRSYKGRSLGTFDGTLKVIDHRGAVKLGKLVLTAGAIEIDCTYNETIARAIKPAIDTRAIIEAWAHYDGSSQLPVRLDVKSARPVKGNADLIKWKGSFKIPATNGDDW
jgi:hypothetical protein